VRHDTIIPLDNSENWKMCAQEWYVCKLSKDNALFTGYEVTLSVTAWTLREYEQQLMPVSFNKTKHTTSVITNMYDLTNQTAAIDNYMQTRITPVVPRTTPLLLVIW
jgi:hypothetical protein